MRARCQVIAPPCAAGFRCRRSSDADAGWLQEAGDLGWTENGVVNMLNAAGEISKVFLTYFLSQVAYGGRKPNRSLTVWII